MYTLYKDKLENFECNIKIEGASLSNAKARLVLENEEFNLIFQGSINGDGKCVIPIKKLKILSEGLIGKLKLEVIVDDDTYFVPYQDDFKINLNKKIAVEVLKREEARVIVEAKPAITAFAVEQKSDSPNQNRENVPLSKFKTLNSTVLNLSEIKNFISKKLKEHNLTVFSIPKNPQVVNSILAEVFKVHNIKRENLPELKDTILNALLDQ